MCELQKEIYDAFGEEALTMFEQYVQSTGVDPEDMGVTRKLMQEKTCRVLTSVLPRSTAVHGIRMLLFLAATAVVYHICSDDHEQRG